MLSIIFCTFILCSHQLGIHLTTLCDKLIEKILARTVFFIPSQACQVEGGSTSTARLFAYAWSQSEFQWSECPLPKTRFHRLLLVNACLLAFLRKIWHSLVKFLKQMRVQICPLGFLQQTGSLVRFLSRPLSQLAQSQGYHHQSPSDYVCFGTSFFISQEIQAKVLY